jgi:hypothetical protein
MHLTSGSGESNEYVLRDLYQGGSRFFALFPPGYSSTPVSRWCISVDKDIWQRQSSVSVHIVNNYNGLKKLCGDFDT